MIDVAVYMEKVRVWLTWVDLGGDSVCVCLHLTEKEKEKEVCVNMHACIHTLLSTHQLCVCVCMCAFHVLVLHFIRTCRDGRSDRFRELTHKSVPLNCLSKKLQHKVLIVSEIQNTELRE